MTIVDYKTINETSNKKWPGYIMITNGHFLNLF